MLVSDQYDRSNKLIYLKVNVSVYIYASSVTSESSKPINETPLSNYQ